jgi:hypothetical protein
MASTSDFILALYTEFGTTAVVVFAIVGMAATDLLIAALRLVKP